MEILRPSFFFKKNIILFMVSYILKMTSYQGSFNEKERKHDTRHNDRHSKKEWKASYHKLARFETGGSTTSIVRLLAHSKIEIDNESL
jgi:hypothetical protein